MIFLIGRSQFLKTLSLFLTAIENTHQCYPQIRGSKLDGLASGRLVIFDSDSRDEFERFKKIKSLSDVRGVLITSDLEPLRLPKSFSFERDHLLICNIRDRREILKVLRVCDGSHASFDMISRVLSHEIFEDTRDLLPNLTRLEGQIFHILSSHTVSRGISDFKAAGLLINAHRLRDHVLTLRRKLLNTRFEIQTVKDIGYRLNLSLQSSCASGENRLDSGLPSLERAGQLILEQIGNENEI